MKRSRSIRLVLLGGISAGVLTSCGPSNQPASVSSQNVYTNNYYVPGVGYYHAPYRAFYAMPFNHFDAKLQRYYHGGQWNLTPSASITNISSPTPDVAAQAEAQRSDIQRGGFGSSSHYRSSWS